MMVVEVIIILAYLATVIFVIDTSTLTGLIIVGVMTLVMIGVVLSMEKKREAMEGTAPLEPATEQQAINHSQPGTPPLTEQQVPPPAAESIEQTPPPAAQEPQQ